MQRLTERQQEVLKLRARGLSVHEVAEKLGVEPATVKGHQHQAYRRLGVKTLLGARMALQMMAGVS